MNKDGIGWPQTYFVWGLVCGSLITSSIVNLMQGNIGISVYGAIGAFVAFYFAKNSDRPLFGD
jgi:hypothetical protein